MSARIRPAQAGQDTLRSNKLLILLNLGAEGAGQDTLWLNKLLILLNSGWRPPPCGVFSVCYRGTTFYI